MILIWASFTCLTAALLSLWGRVSIWVPGLLILAGVSLATYSDSLSLIALSTLLVFDIFVYLEHKQHNLILSRLFPWVIGIMAFGFSAHLIPGFDNYLWLTQLRLSELSAPFNVYLNFDKTIAACLVGLGMLYAPNKPFTGLFQQQVRNWILATVLPVSALCIALLMGVGLVSHYVVVDLKLPNWFGWWFLHNLIFVCIAEELIFRGYIQHKLTQFFVARKKTWVWGLVIASVIFGLLHFKGGPIYILLATIAGLFYGYAYHKTQRIEAGILVHLLLNTVHFIFFSYPYAAVLG